MYIHAKRSKASLVIFVFLDIGMSTTAWETFVGIIHLQHSKIPRIKRRIVSFINFQVAASHLSLEEKFQYQDNRK